MPEDDNGELPDDVDHDKPDEWRDVCDDPPLWGEDDDG